MQMSQKSFLIISCIFFATITSYGYSQCDDLKANYKTHFLKRSLSIDPIEGVWKAYRTVKIYQGDQIKKIKRDNIAETWMIIKQDNNFLVCNGNNDASTPLIFFTKEQNSKYVFNKNYIKQNSIISAYALLTGHKLTFSYAENLSYLKEIMSDKYTKDVRVEYDYELIKEDNYTTKVTEQVPKIKKYLIEGLKNYFNI